MTVISLLVTLTHLLAADTVHHPAPKEPIYIDKGFYSSLQSKLPKPPQPGSSEQKMDERILAELQNTRTTQDCEIAKSEVLVSLKSFYGKPQGPLTDTQVEKLAPFFEQVRNDADYFIQKLKVDFPRKRPFLYISTLNPCVPREVTGAYPSGHAVLSSLFALILSDQHKEMRKELDSRAKSIGRHRILSGMHHPSDVVAGQKLATLIHQELKKSSKYQTDLAQAFEK